MRKRDQLPAQRMCVRAPSNVRRFNELLPSGRFGGPTRDRFAEIARSDAVATRNGRTKAAECVPRLGTGSEQLFSQSKPRRARNRERKQKPSAKSVHSFNRKNTQSAFFPIHLMRLCARRFNLCLQRDLNGPANGRKNESESRAYTALECSFLWVAASACAAQGNALRTAMHFGRRMRFPVCALFAIIRVEMRHYCCRKSMASASDRSRSFRSVISAIIASAARSQ